MVIFEAEFLDTTDLLEFRLVNRSWRDSATSVLLRSSACQISFNIRWVPIPSTIEFDANQAIYCNNRNNCVLLEDLNEIISQSPKFPCSSFRFVNRYSFGDAHYKNKIDTSSLLNFFSIYRNNVKTITVGDFISKSDLRSLLLNYTPCLECLNLQYFHTFGHPDFSIFWEPLFPESVILPNLKTIVLGPDTECNLIELFDAAINLESVETARVADLKFLLDHGKAGLIKKLEFCFHVYNVEELSTFETLAECQPKLTKLIVTAVRHKFDLIRYPDNPELPGTFLKAQTFLNRILESSKDTLKHLELHICPFGDTEFPVLKNLVCLKLVQSFDQFMGRYSTLPSSIPNVPQFEARREHQIDVKRLFPNRPCNSFPNLQKLQLKIKNYRVARDGSLLLLHTCRSHNDKIVPHVYKNVTVLEIFSTLPKTIAKAKSVSNLFPNVTILKLNCSGVHQLKCSLWVLSPLAKSIEIYGISTLKPYWDKDRSDWSSSDDDFDRTRTDDVGLVDSFFTGFSIKMCQKLKRFPQAPTEIEGNPTFMNLMRVKPSICDLKGLTDFKIIFRKLRAPFASYVTGFYAFQNMSKTKVTFAHSAPIKFNEVECQMEKYLAPISTFIHFTHRKMPKCFDHGFEVDNYNQIDSHKDEYSDSDSYSDCHRWSRNHIATRKK